MKDNEIYRLAFKQFCLFCFWVAAARLSRGFALPVMAVFGVAWALKGAVGKAFSIYAMMMMMTSMNPNILPTMGMMSSIGLRFGPLLIGMALAMKGATATGRQALPMGMMLLYLLVALGSSVDGWCPQVSYLKLMNFLVFFLGIWIGTKGLHQHRQEIKTLRATFLALAAFLILGSAAIWPFPGLSTLNSMSMIRDVEDIAMRNELIREMIDSGRMTLFCGVMNQSQALSPLLACAFSWVLCDLLFVEAQFRWQHGLLLILALPLFYLTRSRTALVALVVILGLVYFYLPKKLALGRRMKMWLGHILLWGGIGLAILVMISETQSDAITRWVRKTDEVDTDQRSLTEALTSSRQGLIDMCMDDFRQRPLIGMGFQVAEYTPQLVSHSKGLILSSPIEKGVIPIMILGETGVTGAVVFVFFVCSFCAGCARKRLFLSMAMMEVLLALNMGEATFFSPGGIGGPEWIFCIVGGYALDLYISNMQRRKMMGGYNYHEST